MTSGNRRSANRFSTASALSSTRQASVARYGPRPSRCPSHAASSICLRTPEQALCVISWDTARTQFERLACRLFASILDLVPTLWRRVSTRWAFSRFLGCSMLRSGCRRSIDRLLGRSGWLRFRGCYSSMRGGSLQLLSSRWRRWNMSFGDYDGNHRKTL
jgi:hypothetical protein